VESFAAACRFAAASGAQLVDDLAAQVETAREQLAGVRPQAVAWKVLPHLVAHPVINAPALRALGFGAQSAQNALAQLAGAGVLEERTGQQCNRVWQHAGVLAVLDAYAQGLRRG
jgi:hypothetical protein